MKNKNMILSFAILLIISAALSLAAYFASTLATQYDLGQLAYLFLIFFPIAAAVTGVLANVMTDRWWIALVISLLVFVGFMLIKYNAINFRYVLTYMLISLVGYYISHFVRRITKR